MIISQRSIKAAVRFLYLLTVCSKAKQGIKVFNWFLNKLSPIRSNGVHLSPYFMVSSNCTDECFCALNFWMVVLDFDFEMSLQIYKVKTIYSRKAVKCGSTGAWYTSLNSRSAISM